MARALAPCGTAAAYRRHLRHQEIPCAECCAAQPAVQRERRGAPVRGRYRVQGCGTNAGYHAHRRRGEEPCGLCRQARNAYSKGRYVPSPREVAPCGTAAAYQRHLRRGEPTCQVCRDGWNALRRRGRLDRMISVVWAEGVRGA